MRELPCGAALGEITHTGRRRVAAHGHERPFFCLLLSGSYEERVGGRRIGYGPLGAAYHPPGVSHREEVGPHGARLFGVRLGRAFLERLGDTPVPREVHVEGGGGELSWLALRLRREWRRPDASALAMQGLLLEMLALVARARPVDAREAARAAAAILRDGLARRVTLADLARGVRVPASVLVQSFRRAYGCSPAAFQRRLRVEAACRELAVPSRSLADVAALAGFADQSHLNRVFRRHTGVTPLAFRKGLA